MKSSLIALGDSLRCSLCCFFLCSFVLFICAANVVDSSHCFCYCWFVALHVLRRVHHIVLADVGSSYCFYCYRFVTLLVLWLVHHISYVVDSSSRCLCFYWLITVLVVLLC